MRNGPRGANMHCKEMDAALAADPPKITWEKRNGVMVAVEVIDHHGEQRKRKPTEKARARQVVALEEARRRVVQMQADGVAERVRTHRVNNTPLLNAARTI